MADLLEPAPPTEMYVTLHCQPGQPPEILDDLHTTPQDADDDLALRLDQARRAGDHHSWYATAKVTVIDGWRQPDTTTDDQEADAVMREMQRVIRGG
ncbi:hypothetical protein CcI49_30025 [Frankia sp. CcI49]|uniref:hypothetical protein n=1 Tax=Frankia sp. CcI49 TaxID=1745382 RepID=UPI0009774CD0|nr:hypothetical protein [Frankia sp. CcI49]ONH54606.1 hypothetical protein CcI49_30025 [Frankia sp. CcI49]